MILLTKIENLFQSSHKITSVSISPEILHPQIETLLIQDHGDKIANAWIIGVFSTKINNFIYYTCVVSPNNVMYRIEHINTKQISKAYHEGFKVGEALSELALNPYNIYVDPAAWKEWVYGYRQGYKSVKELPF